MTRLAVPILILLLMLFAGVAWLLIAYLDLPQMAVGPPAAPTPTVSEQQAPAPTAEARDQAPTTGGEASFDVARIDPKGTSVFAGRAEPGATVTVLGDGQALGTAEADENGEWTLATEHPVASADPKLALTVKSAAQTKAEKTAQAKVAGSLETREAVKEAPKSALTGTISSKLLKEFEGVVAAARTEAKQKAAEEAKAREQKEDVKGDAVKGTKEVATTAPAATPAAPAPPSTTSPPAAPSVASPPTASPPALPPAVALNETQPPMRLSGAVPEEPAQHKSIPVPITFIYNEANFTDDGRKAAALLLEYLQLKHFPSVQLTGHADERGTEEFNMDLSRERLDTVARFLKSGGFEGQLDLIPKGETEPFSGVVRSQFSQEEIWQFDRRVELIVTP
jgi:outer membrane protein OmpA-like peptidoglycan-associated protein